MSKYSPQTVFEDKGGLINFTFSYLDVTISKTELSDTIDGFKASIKQKNPASTFYDLNVEKESNPPSASFDYRVNVMDGEIYMVMFIAVIKGKLLLSTFNCSFEKKNSYQLFAYRILKSIEEVGEDIG